MILARTRRFGIRAEPVAAPISLSAIPDPEKYVDVALIAEALRTLATGRLPDLSVFLVNPRRSDRGRPQRLRDPRQPGPRAARLSSRRRASTAMAAVARSSPARCASPTRRAQAISSGGRGTDGVATASQIFSGGRPGRDRYGKSQRAIQGRRRRRPPRPPRRAAG